MKKLTHEFIKKQHKKFGYKLLSEYKNSWIKNLIECPVGHQYNVTYNHFQQGHRCLLCSIEFRREKLKYTHKFVKEQFEKEGYKLLSEYKNNHIKNLVKCPFDHQYKVRYDYFQQGCRCPICAGNQKLTYDFVKEQFEVENYKLLSKKYISANKKVLVECPKGHQYKVGYSSFKQGCRCPICWELETHSRSEKDCLDVVKQMLPNENIIENDRSQIINPKTNWNLELDIWIPSLNKAIEFNGERWHNNDYSKYKDDQKNIQCKEKNIDLITIWYQDWINHREEQIQKLKGFINNVR